MYVPLFITWFRYNEYKKILANPTRNFENHEGRSLHGEFQELNYETSRPVPMVPRSQFNSFRESLDWTVLNRFADHYLIINSWPWPV